MDRIEIGKRVKDERNKNGWSQENLAGDTNVSIRTIQRIENGENTIGKDTLLQVLEFLSIEYCDEGYISVPELSSIGTLIENLFKYKVDLNRGNFEIEELKLLLKFVNFLEEFEDYWLGDRMFSFKESIHKEIRLREILEELEEYDIKIYCRLKYDATIIDNREVGYGIYKTDIIENQIYVYKKDDKNVLIKKDYSTYINIENTDYSNLKKDRLDYGIKDSDIFKYRNLFTEEEYENYVPDEFPF